jgi:septum formation protein
MIASTSALPRIVLASASPRRRELLAQAGFTFIVQAANIPEERRADETPARFVLRLAEEKARAVWAVRHATEHGELVVLAADTIVHLDGEVLGKPVDAEDARRMLLLLAGRTHQVLTGVAVLAGERCVTAVETTQVTFSTIGEDELGRYIASGEPMDKAGAYGIQGYAARWIPRIEGDYNNVVGLPIARTVALLAQIGA